MAVLTAQGMESAMKMLKVFEPNAFDTAMFPSPCRATSTDAKRFGSEVLAAVTVRPIRSS